MKQSLKVKIKNQKYYIVYGVFAILSKNFNMQYGIIFK